jgi:hypothetical protein
MAKRLANMNMSPEGLAPSSSAQQQAHNCKVSKTRLRYTATISRKVLTKVSPAWIFELEV